MDLSTQQKGQLAQLKIEQRAIEKGWITSRPSNDCRYDLVLDDGVNLYRAQIKYVDGDHSDGALQIYLRKNHKNRALVYSRDEIDLVLAYIPMAEKIVCLRQEHFHHRPQFTMRYAPTKNGQSKGVNLIDQFIW